MRLDRMVGQFQPSFPMKGWTKAHFQVLPAWAVLWPSDLWMYHPLDVDANYPIQLMLFFKNIRKIPQMSKFSDKEFTKEMRVVGESQWHTEIITNEVFHNRRNTFDRRQDSHSTSPFTPTMQHEKLWPFFLCENKVKRAWHVFQIQTMALFPFNRNHTISYRSFKEEEVRLRDNLNFSWNCY